MVDMPRRLFAISIVARLPLPMLSIGLLVHTQRLTGSFAAAGIVAAVVAAVLGLSVPPVGACLRALLPGLVSDTRAAYAAEATASELTFIAGPPLVLLAGSVWSTGIALAGAGAVLVAGTFAFAAQPASRAWRGAARPGGGSLADPGV